MSVSNSVMLQTNHKCYTNVRLGLLAANMMVSSCSTSSPVSIGVVNHLHASKIFSYKRYVSHKVTRPCHPSVVGTMGTS